MLFVCKPSRENNLPLSCSSHLLRRMQGLPYWVGEVPPHQLKICSFLHYSSSSIFVLISYSLDTQVMLILVLIDVQYSQKAVFSFEKGSNCQNHSSSDFLNLVKKSPPSKISNPRPHPLLLFGKPWHVQQRMNSSTLLLTKVMNLQIMLIKISKQTKSMAQKIKFNNSLAEISQKIIIVSNDVSRCFQAYCY